MKELNDTETAPNPRFLDWHRLALTLEPLEHLSQLRVLQSKLSDQLAPEQPDLVVEAQRIV
ncbi:hypothetical protein IFT66_22130 [Rhizobium sp. CFBP 13726]|uniref:hypothetical protein n=1 Tax=Rhizobium sp. CFBP 13726 TaxID=2775296 RepID=UPI0017802D16|nr:hypothetical protein [Rhizobium sp. CFBP 13726]MBD8653798.1 hypothetical protein [Rhizobium sp. CFBP 13726]